MEQEILMPEKIRNLRAYLGLSQASFSKPLNLSPTHIARFEKGISEPSEAVINAICSIYEVDARHFQEDLPVEKAVVKHTPEAGIPQRLKSAREAKGWSQYRLAKESGVAQPVVNRVEAGANLTIKQGSKLAESLGVGIDWLMKGDEKKKSYPADQKMIDWLWQNEDERRAIWEKMNTQSVQSTHEQI